MQRLSMSKKQQQQAAAKSLIDTGHPFVILSVDLETKNIRSVVDMTSIPIHASCAAIDQLISELLDISDVLEQEAIDKEIDDMIEEC